MIAKYPGFCFNLNPNVSLLTSDILFGSRRPCCSRQILLDDAAEKVKQQVFSPSGGWFESHKNVVTFLVSRV